MTNTIKRNALLANIQHNDSYGNNTLLFLKNEITGIFNRFEAQSYGSPVTEILFIPYAFDQADYASYKRSVENIFSPLGITVKSITEIQGNIDETVLLTNAQAIVTGGGNFEYLLKKLKSKNLINIIRQKILDGFPYVGWNEGSEIVSPVIMQNFSESFLCFNIISFQLCTGFIENDSHTSALKNFLMSNPTISKAACLTQITEDKGSGIWLEDVKSGLATGTDSGGGSLPGKTPLLIYKIQNNNLAKEPIGDPNNLPLNV